MLHLMFNCILFVVIIYELPFVVQAQINLIVKRQPQHKGYMFSTSLSFPEGARFAGNCSILEMAAIGFSQ